MRALQSLFAVVACTGVAPNLGQAPLTKKTSFMCPGAMDLAGYGKVAVTAAGWADPGVMDLAGYGKVEVTAAGWAESSNGSKLQVTNDISGTGVTLFTNARAYFANTCEEMSYDHRRYLALNLLGKTMRYTADISGAGCGCNAAFYLVSMPQNEDVSDCGDYYCDVNATCGVFCAEIDIQEANQHAWRSTLHSSHDREGRTDGSGGGGAANWTGPRSFTLEQYSPGGRCVDTSKPFNVTVSFPVDGKGSLSAMVVELSQEGESCSLERKMSDYDGNRELEQALTKGMTPVISYWHSKDMLWLDSNGSDGKGPCTKDTLKCGESIRFYDFAVAGSGGPESFLGQSAKRTTSPTSTSTSGPVPAGGMPGKGSDGHQHVTNGSLSRCAKSTENCRTVACCSEPGMQCYEKSRYWSGCRESCIQEFSGDGWTCKRLGPRTPQGGWDENHPVPSMASTTSNSQGDGDIGTTATTAPKDKGKTSQASGAAARGRGSDWKSSSPFKLLAAAALVVLPSLVAIWFFNRARQDTSNAGICQSRDIMRAAESERPNPCNPQDKWRGPPQQPDLPPVRASQTVFDTWNFASGGRNRVSTEEEEPASTWQQLHALFAGCSLGTCRVNIIRARQ